MAKKQIDLGLTGLDELFMDDKERVESQLPKIYEIPLSEIDEFPNGNSLPCTIWIVRGGHLIYSSGRGALSGKAMRTPRWTSTPM